MYNHLIYSTKDEDEELYGRTLSSWKDYAKKAYEAEKEMKAILADTPNILETKNLRYDESRMTIVKVNKKVELINEDVDFNDQGEAIIIEPKKLPLTSYIKTQNYKVTDPITSIKYMAEYVDSDEDKIEKVNIFNYIPFQFATLEGRWNEIDSMEEYVKFKDLIRTALYKKKSSYFRFNETVENEQVVNTMKRELFIAHMERETFIEIDAKFKELIMSAQS